MQGRPPPPPPSSYAPAFGSLNFALVAGISFSTCVAGAQNKANLDVYIHPWSLIYTTWFQQSWCQNVFDGRIYKSLVDQGFKTSTYIYLLGILPSFSIRNFFTCPMKVRDNACWLYSSRHWYSSCNNKTAIFVEKYWQPIEYYHHHPNHVVIFAHFKRYINGSLPQCSGDT